MRKKKKSRRVILRVRRKSMDMIQVFLLVFIYLIIVIGPVSIAYGIVKAELDSLRGELKELQKYVTEITKKM